MTLAARLRLGPIAAVPTAIAVAGVALLLALGVWQVARHFETAAENELRAAALALPPLPLDEVLAAPQRFRRAVATGRFAHERELHVHGRSPRGNEGFWVVTPLLREAGPPILVNRGWVPRERRDPARRAEGQVAGPVTVEGVLRTEPRANWIMRAGVCRPGEPRDWWTRVYDSLTVANCPPTNDWFWFDLPAMQAAAGLAGAPLVYLEAGSAPNAGGFPLGGQTLARIERPHLQYAATWFALAIGLAAVWFVYHRRRGPA